MRDISIAVALALLSGCLFGNKTLDDGPYCEDTATVVALDEVTELGFAAVDLLALAEGTHDETFTWARDGSTTPVMVVVDTPGEARFVHSEAVYPDTGGERLDIAVLCEDRVEVDVSVALTTADGAFDEAWTVALQGGTAAQVSLFRELDPDALVGTYDMAEDITEPDYDERSLWVQADWTEDAVTGTIEGQVSGGDSDCDDGDVCTAWASIVEVGAWGLGI